MHKQAFEISRLLGICKLSKMVRVMLMYCMLALISGLVFAQGSLEKQSPINIQTAHVESNEALGALNNNYYPAHATMVDKEYEIQVVWSGDAGSLEIDGVKYRLSQCHWHQPSEHTINGLRYPFELHMVHISDNKEIAVIGILYEFGPPDHFLDELRSVIHDISHAKEIDLESIDPKKIKMRRDAAYYRYSGSLTTHPFTEPVIWTVIKEAKTATHEQVRDLWDALLGKSNSREVQPLNGRVVELYEDNHAVDTAETYKAEQTILSWSS